MKEIVPNIWTWSWLSEEKGYDFNGHLVLHPDGNLVIDPVQMDDHTLDAIAGHGVARILITNRNHSRVARSVKERTGARVAIHPADQPHASENGLDADDPLEVGATFGPLVVIAAAGKSPGEVALHWPERRILFVGDAFVGNPPGRLSLLPDKVMDDPDGMRESVRRIAAEVDFDIALLGDGTSILANAKAAVQELIATF